MPKYRTLDQHVVYHKKTIEPYTPVNVPDEDIDIWEELVTLKVAERVQEDLDALYQEVKDAPEGTFDDEVTLAEPPAPEAAPASPEKAPAKRKKSA